MKCHRIIGLAILLFLAPLAYAQSVEQYSFAVDTTYGQNQKYTLLLIGAEINYGDKYETQKVYKHLIGNFNREAALNILFKSSENDYDINRFQKLIMGFDITKNGKIIGMRLVFPLPDDKYEKTISKKACIKMIHSFERSGIFRPWENNVEVLTVKVFFKQDEVIDAIAAYKASKHNTQ